MQLDLQLWENLKHWSFENQKCGVQFLSHPSAETLLEFCLGVTKHANTVFWLCLIREKKIQTKHDLFFLSLTY